MGHGNVGEEPCTYCSETGFDPFSCEQCEADGEVYNEDGKFLCGDCWFEWHIEHEVAESFERADKNSLTTTK